MSYLLEGCLPVQRIPAVLKECIPLRLISYASHHVNSFCPETDMSGNCQLDVFINSKCVDKVFSFTQFSIFYDSFPHK